MTYKEEIWKELRENTGLRLKIALALNIGEAGVQRAIERKSGSLTKYAAVQVIKDELKLKDKEIFEQESAKA